MSKLICPNCGAEMNHHATKVDHSMDDAEFDGALKDAYFCPHCGHSELIDTP